MDKQLLKALDNLGLALEALTDALQSKKETKTDTAASLKSGDFGKQLESINVGIKSIKADTQEILNNQKTILDLQRKKDSDKKTGEFESAENDKKKKSNILSGVATILLIAVAVLAIGMAFKIVGKVDFLSVVGLGIAIVLIAFAFDKVAKSGLTPRTALMASIVMGVLSLGVLVSSMILSKVKKITLMQFVTSVMIATLFYFVAPIMADVINRLQDETEIFVKDGTKEKKVKTKKMSWNKLFGMIIGLPLIMAGMSLGILVSSWLLSKVRPMTLPQIITAGLIAGMFSIVAPGIKGLIHALTEETEVQAKGFGGKQKGLSIMKLLQVCLILPLLMASISAGITLSSWILSLVKPISFTQALTAIAIGIMFSIISFGLKGLLSSLAIILQLFGMGTMLKLAGITVLILPAIALAITISSWILSKVAPLSFMQIFVAIAITIMFAIMSYVMPYLAVGIVLIDKLLGAKKIFMIPLVLVLIALAITLSSHILAKMADIPWMRILKILAYGIVMALVVTAFTPAVIFLGLLPLSSLIKGVVGIVLIAVAIVVSSHILAKGKYDKPPKWSWTLQTALAYLLFAPAVVILGSIPLPIMIFGLINVAIVAAAIVLTDKILSKGKYTKFPPIKWTLSVIAVMAPFALGMALLGPLIIPVALGFAAVLLVAAGIVATDKILSKGKYQKFPPTKWTAGVLAIMVPFSLMMAAVGFSIPLIWLGSFAIEMIADSIVDTSKRLSKGNYDRFPPLEWTKSVVIIMGLFTAGIIGVGALIVGTLGLGWILLKAGREGVLMIADTIVDVAERLRKGSFIGGPTKEWAEGVAIALGAFSPIYKMLVDNAFWTYFGIGGIGPNDYANAIRVVTEGIVIAAKEFAKHKAEFKEGPPKKWAQGVSLALGAFQGVYKILVENSGWFSSGVSVEDYRKAIRVISEGIVEAAKFFARNRSPFKEGNYPSKKWGLGVGKAIGAFSPVFQVLSSMSWFRKPATMVQAMKDGIIKVAEAIVDAGRIFAEASLDSTIWDPKNVPGAAWGKGVSRAIEAFGSVFVYMNENSGLFTGADEVVSDMCYAIGSIAEAITYAAQQFMKAKFTDYPTEKWASNTDAAVRSIVYTSKFLIDQYGESNYEIGWGLYTISSKMKEVAGFLRGSSGWQTPSVKWTNMVDFTFRRMARTEYALYLWTKDETYTLGDIILRQAKVMNRVAKTLFSAREAFGYEIPGSFIPMLRKNMLDFQSLVHELAAGEEKGMFEILGDAFGRAMGEKDPIIMMADRMVALAKGYSALADSLIKLGAAMRSVNVKNLNQLGSFTKGVAGKLPGMKKEKTEEEKPSWFNSIKSSFTGMFGDKKEEKKSGFIQKVGDEKNKISYVSEKLEELIKIMKNIDRSTSKVDEYISEMTNGKLKSGPDNKNFGIAAD